MFLCIDAQKLFRENFEKQFQEMMKKFKIKPVRFNYTPACSALTHADRMSPNAQVLGHQTVRSTKPFTGKQSLVVT